MNDHSLENARTLASLLNIQPDEAAVLLGIHVGITADSTDAPAWTLAQHLKKMLSRTVDHVTVGIDHGPTKAEIVVGGAPACTPGATRLHLNRETITVGPAAPVERIDDRARPIALVLAACYGAAAVLRAALDGRLQVPGPSHLSTFTIATATFFGKDDRWLEGGLELQDTYLAGAGAIGNGFLYALATLSVSGTLVVVDYDTVSEGNLNRCVWFTRADLGRPKATRLVELAQPSFSRLSLVAKDSTLQDVGKVMNAANWLRRLVVAVDSRRARRRLQTEIPREVFDVSTTGAEEIVLHHHLQPTDDACLACIYHESPDELAHERHVAEALGVNLHEVQQHLVSSSASLKIHALYPTVPAESIIGKAYDSLFKSLCSSMALRASEDRQVFAPFAFVSVLAGACVAIELARRCALGEQAWTFNYWRVSPWAPPVAALKQVRPREPRCEFCAVPAFRATVELLWARQPTGVSQQQDIGKC